jgi:hypothetical protein
LVAAHLRLTSAKRHDRTAAAGQQPAAAVCVSGNPASATGKFGLAMAKKALQRRIWRQRGDSA